MLKGGKKNEASLSDEWTLKENCCQITLQEKTKGRDL